MIPIIFLTIENDNDRLFMIDLYNDHYGLMYKYAKVIIRDRDLAEDIVQSACEKLIDKISVLRSLPPEALPKYIITVVRCTAINFYNHRKKVASRETAAFYDYGQEYEVPSEENIEEKILLKMEVGQLQQSIGRLPQNYQDILNYKYLLDLSDKEIGKIMGYKPDSVRKILQRARAEALNQHKKEQ